MTRIKPAYFLEVEKKARERWEQLERDPELAAPWWQLFRQVQSPRHVLSELLQNADDAGATWARARITETSFIFEHNGADFAAEDLGSLCRFGFSNKRQLHTIGFRGIGFKSTFSLGDSVSVLTPTLALRFDKDRFTQPKWVDAEGKEGCVRIVVPISDPNRKKSLYENFNEWSQNPASLLFFRHITELTIDGHVIKRVVKEAGPVANTTWYELTSDKMYRVLFCESDEKEFPKEAIEEIRKERMVEDIAMPPCRVNIVLGLPSDQRLYAILPTDIRTGLPFSCNAPFMQDPARTGIKDPGASPTNRWLLTRCGDLARSVLDGWLGNTSLTIDDRVAAYQLLPRVIDNPNTLAQATHHVVAKAFSREQTAPRVLLSAAGYVGEKTLIAAVDPELYGVWSSEELSQIFYDGKLEILAEQVDRSSRERLIEWRWLQGISPDGALKKLTMFSPPRPKSLSRILQLWSYLEQPLSATYSFQYRNILSIVPVLDEEKLLPATEVVNLGSQSDPTIEKIIDCLSQVVRPIDPQWMAVLGMSEDMASGSKGFYDQLKVSKATTVLRKLELARPVPIRDLIRKSVDKLDRLAEESHECLVKITHALAAMNTDIHPSYPYLCSDGVVRQVSRGLIQDPTAAGADLFPGEWLAAHEIDSAYSSDHDVCNTQQWLQWILSGKSGLRTFVPPIELKKELITKRVLNNLLASAGYQGSVQTKISRDVFSVKDFDFSDVMWRHWDALSKTDGSIWARVMKGVMEDVAKDWSERSTLTVYQEGTTRSHALEVKGVVATWIRRLRELPCLLDTYSVPRKPQELLMRTRETEPFMGVEPFVHSDMDGPYVQSLLRLLGVGSSPFGVKSLIERLRVVSQMTSPPLNEIMRWYQALDQSVARMSLGDFEESGLAEVFSKEALILGNDHCWYKTSEVFCENDPLLPGEPSIHEVAASFPVWARIGVEKRPSTDALIRSLGSLETDAKLDDKQRERVKGLLSVNPEAVLKTEYWLSVSGKWRRISTLSWYVDDTTSGPVSSYYAGILDRTADMRRLPLERVETLARQWAKPISSQITYEVSGLDGKKPLGQQDWFLMSGSCISRIKQDDPMHAQQMRDLADYIAVTQWWQCPEFTVTPFIGESPIAAPQRPPVLWNQHEMLVRQVPGPGNLESIVREVAKGTADTKLASTLRSVALRDPEFVQSYFDANYELVSIQDSPVATQEAELNVEGGAVVSIDKENREALINGGADDVAIEYGDVIDNGDISNTPNNEDDDDVDCASTVIIERVRKTRKSQKQGSIDIVAGLYGLIWDGQHEEYTGMNGYRLVNNKDTNSWSVFDSNGEMLREYYPVTGEAGKYLVVDSILWETLQQYPGKTSLIFDGPVPVILGGDEIVSGRHDQKIAIYPESYRLVWS